MIKEEGGLRKKGIWKKSCNDSPLITIITVVLNGENYLEKTIQSIINQPYKNIEYIIIDGGSTDRTIDIIRKYENKIDYWISEKDNGIYDAMNKGIQFAKGEGLLFLNAGDYFVGKVLNDKIRIPSFLPVKYENIFKRLKNFKIKNYKIGIPNCHQGIIFKNKGIKYDLTYKVAADYDYFLRHGYTNNLPIIKSEGYVYYDSKGYNAKNYILRDKEILEIIKKNKFNSFYKYYFRFLSIIKKIIKYFLF